MRQLKIYLISLLVTISGLVLFLNNSSSKAENLCNGGRCTGSSNCRACKNCSRCAHCSSGGTCGVCATPTTKTIYKTSKLVNTAPKKNNGSSNHKSYSAIYKVIAKNLNIRKRPSTDSNIIYTLRYGDTVTVIKVVNEKWFEVEVNGVKGYAFREYISKK